MHALKNSILFLALALACSTLPAQSASRKVDNGTTVTFADHSENLEDESDTLEIAPHMEDGAFNDDYADDSACCDSGCCGHGCCGHGCCGHGCCGNEYCRIVCDSCCDTIHESLCGPAKCWRPLTFDTFFSEGWNEAWAGGPAGQYGLTPRHGWLGAFEGAFYRLWLVNGTYQHNLNQPFGGDGYGANFGTFLPFSRRFELYVNAPFVSANGTLDPNQGYRTDFGDLQVAGSFLLSETPAATHLFTLGLNMPTGETETGGGRSYLNPRYSFWSNPWGAWVVRGGLGVNIPLNDVTTQKSLNTALAIGRYFRPHDVAFGDLVFYLNTAIDVPLEGGGPTSVGIGPGTRFQIGGNWWFLHYWQFPVTNPQPWDYQMQTAIVKAW